MKIPKYSARKAQECARELMREQGWSAAQAWRAAMANMRHEYNTAKIKATQYGFFH